MLHFRRRSKNRCGSTMNRGRGRGEFRNGPPPPSELEQRIIAPSVSIVDELPKLTNLDVAVEVLGTMLALTSIDPKAELTDVLAIDCEGVGTGAVKKANRGVAARVSIVNAHGQCVYDTFVKPPEPVTDYRTWLTGIEAVHLENARDLAVVQKEVQEMVRGRKLVGHALQNDFKMLKYEHPGYLVRDTSSYDVFISLAQKCHPSLKLLAKVVLGKEIHTGIHDSVDDARIAMQLYQLHKAVWEESEYGWPSLACKPPDSD